MLPTMVGGLAMQWRPTPSGRCRRLNGGEVFTKEELLDVLKGISGWETSTLTAGGQLTTDLAWFSLIHLVRDGERQKSRVEKSRCVRQRVLDHAALHAGTHHRSCLGSLAVRIQRSSRTPLAGAVQPASAFFPNAASSLIFIPVNHNNYHWSLLVFNRPFGKWYHYDSSPSPPPHQRNARELVSFIVGGQLLVDAIVEV